MILAAGVSTQGHAFNFGPAAGGTVGWVGGSDWDTLLKEGDYKNTTQGSIAYGAIFEFEFFSFLSFRPEIHILSPAGKAKGDQKTLRVDTRTLQIPFLFTGKYPVRSGYVYALLGPSMNLFLQEIDTEEEISGEIGKYSEQPYYGMVWGVTAGIGYEIPVRSLKVLADMRYNRTLSLIFKEWDTNFQNLSFLAGVVFSIPQH
jgi:hypothetical protein